MYLQLASCFRGNVASMWLINRAFMNRGVPSIPETPMTRIITRKKSGNVKEEKSETQCLISATVAFSRSSALPCHLTASGDQVKAINRPPVQSAHQPSQRPS